MPPTTGVGRPPVSLPVGCQAPGPAEAKLDRARAPWAKASNPREDRAVGCALDVPSPRHAGDNGTPPVEGVPAVCTHVGGVRQAGGARASAAPGAPNYQGAQEAEIDLGKAIHTCWGP